MQLRKPQSKKELQRYLGMINLLTKFIPNLAQVRAPLNRLRSDKDKIFIWNEECDETFDHIQKMVTETKILIHPNFKNRFYIQTDASNDCIGAMLFQYDYGKVCPIEFMSKKLSESQINWHSNEKECYAVLYAVKKWYKFLSPNEFTILTDHKNFEILLQSVGKISNSRTLRWALYLKGECRFIVRHIKGEDNIPADYLSRDIMYDTKYHTKQRNMNEYCFMVEKTIVNDKLLDNLEKKSDKIKNAKEQAKKFIYKRNGNNQLKMNIESFEKEVDSGSEDIDYGNYIQPDFPDIDEEKKVEIDFNSDILSTPSFLTEINEEEESDDAYILGDDLSMKDIDVKEEMIVKSINLENNLKEKLWKKGRNIELILEGDRWKTLEDNITWDVYISPSIIRINQMNDLN